MSALDLVLEDSPLCCRAAILEELLSDDDGEQQPRPKQRKKIENKQPRRGDPDATGFSRWRIPIEAGAWKELNRPERYDEGSYDGLRFQSIYGVPAKMFDELVSEARLHEHLAGKQRIGDGHRGPISKPLELKVAAVLEMCQSGLIFKTAERLYDISKQVLCPFFHEFVRLQVACEYDKHVYVPEGLCRSCSEYMRFGGGSAQMSTSRHVLQ